MISVPLFILIFNLVFVIEQMLFGIKQILEKGYKLIGQPFYKIYDKSEAFFKDIQK